MKILITGYKGFIGQHAVEHFDDIELFEWGDPFPSLRGIDLVMHFGAISSTTKTDVEKVLRQNYDFSVQLIEACNLREVPFQYSSSASVYGLGNDFKETAMPDPRTPYAWSKYLFERYVLRNRWDIKVQGFRYFNVYGDKGESHKGDQASPYHKFRTQAKETGVIKIFKNSEEYRRDFIHVHDIINLHEQFFTIKESGIWNFGTGMARSFYDVAAQIATETGAKIEVIPMPENLKNSYQAYTCADTTKLHRSLHVKV